MSITGWECYETPDETMTKIKHAIKLAARRVWNPMVELLKDDLLPTVSIEEVQDGQCRWPIESVNWCGRACKDGSVYCETHYQRSIPNGAVARSENI